MKPGLRQYLILVALLLVMLAQMSAASPTQSAAFDETYHITFGYAYLRTGDARLSLGQNPPLTDVLIALPLMLRNDIAFPSDHPTWASADIFGFSNEFLWQANADPHRLVMLARLPEMMLALVLACVVYAFTRTLFGRRAALAAMFFCALDPNVLAQGHIAGADLGLTLFMVSTVWIWTSALKRMNAKRAAVAGLLTGAALATKYSAVWLVLSLVFIELVYPAGHSTWLVRIKLLIIAGLMALIVIWATFGFSVGPITSGGLTVPAPQYWQSVSKVANRVESSTPAYLLGQISPTGFPLYYPVVFLLKTPLPTLILLVIGAIGLIVRHRRADIPVWFLPLSFMLAAMLGGLDLGYRLILPVLPFALMLAGQGVAALLSGKLKAPRRADLEKLAGRTLWLRGSVAGLLVAWLVIDVLSIGPGHLAYFNQLAGDRSRDYELLVDSNLDWGQDLIALREWMQQNRVDRVNLAFFGTAHPDAYHVSARLLASFPLNDHSREIDGFNSYALPPGWYAISATSLQLGTLYARWQMYAPFRVRKPDARAGRSILLYHVAYPSSGIDRTVVLGPVATDLDQATLGGNPDRQLIVKWAGDDAAVLDMQGPARYIARAGESIAGFAPEVQAALLAQSKRLESNASDYLQVFEIDMRAALRQKLNALQNNKVLTPDGLPLVLPIQFEGGLSLIGYDLADEPGKPIDLVGYWRVDQAQRKRLKVFAEAVDQTGHVVSQSNGMNVNWATLEAGDVIIQHLAIGHRQTARMLRLGLYDPGTGQRQLALGHADHVTLPLVP